MSSFKTVEECMRAPDSQVQNAASSSGIQYITLDTQKGKLSVCSQLSAHQQPFFTKQGINPLIQQTLKKQEEDCHKLCEL